MSENPSPRGSSRSARYRLQFAWAEAAIKASSTIAAAWLQKPATPGGESILLGLFYFRKPPTASRHKAQVWRITRESDGKIKAAFLGSAPGHTEAYRTFYQPLRLEVRTAQKAAKTAALAQGITKARKAADMAARIVVGTPSKNDKRDLAVATRA